MPHAVGLYRALGFREIDRRGAPHGPLRLHAAGFKLNQRKTEGFAGSAKPLVFMQKRQKSNMAIVTLLENEETRKKM